jgi:RHS repeat-associated protein
LIEDYEIICYYHLGNVLVTISDKKKLVIDDGSGTNNNCIAGTTIDVLDVNTRNTSIPNYVATQEIDIENGFTSTAGDAYTATIDNTLTACVQPDTVVAGNYYKADVVTAGDYYPFGQKMPGREFDGVNGVYRYGFNGKRKDDAINGDGVDYDYGARIYDARIGKWLSLDPLQKKYPDESPYLYTGGNPITFRDIDGKDRIVVHTTIYDLGGGATLTLTSTHVIKGEYLQYQAANGQYNYYDQTEYSTTFVDVNKGTTEQGGSMNVTGPLKFTSKYDITTISGKLGRYGEEVQDLWNGINSEDNKQGARDGGGIMFTSSEGRGLGKGPISTHVDDLPINIDAIVGTLGQLMRTTNAADRAKTVLEAVEKDVDAMETGSDLGDKLKEATEKYKKYAKNTVVCSMCNGGPHPQDGTPAYKIGNDGQVTDTLIKNLKTGEVEDHPTQTGAATPKSKPKPTQTSTQTPTSTQ